MAEPACRVVTVLRGDARAASTATGSYLAPVSESQPARTPPATAPAESIYGVPVSAVQYCCGRGCKHCRIYWHRS